MTQRETMGGRMRRLRESRGWTQGALATYAKVPRSWLGNVETDKSRRPLADYLDRVAKTLGVSAAYLLHGHGSESEITITGPEELASRLRRIAQYPPDVIARFERVMADLFDLHDKETGSEPDQKRDDQPEDDGPHAPPHPKR